MEQLPQHQRELEKVDFINDIRKYIVKFDNESMVLKIPQRDYRKFKIDIEEAMKLCESISWINESLNSTYVIEEFTEIEFNWILHVRKYLWYKFGLGSPSFNW